MKNWNIESNPLNTIQHMIDNAKIDYAHIYAEGDNPIYKVKKFYLNPNGTVRIPNKKGIMIYDVEEKNCLVKGAQNVYNWLNEVMLFEEINSSSGQREQVKDYFKKLGAEV